MKALAGNEQLAACRKGVRIVERQLEQRRDASAEEDLFVEKMEPFADQAREQLKELEGLQKDVTGEFTRAVKYELDFESYTATIVWQFAFPLQPNAAP